MNETQEKALKNLMTALHSCRQAGLDISQQPILWRDEPELQIHIKGVIYRDGKFVLMQEAV